MKTKFTLILKLTMSIDLNDFLLHFLRFSDYFTENTISQYILFFAKGEQIPFQETVTQTIFSQCSPGLLKV